MINYCAKQRGHTPPIYQPCKLKKGVKMDLDEDDRGYTPNPLRSPTPVFSGKDLPLTESSIHSNSLNRAENGGTNKENDPEDTEILPHVKESAARLRDATAPQTASDRYIIRVLWIIAYVVLFGIFLLQFSLLVKKYLKFDTDIQIEIQTAQSLNFPAVTVCNENPLRKSLLGRIKQFEDLVLLDDYSMGYVMAVAENGNSALNFDCGEGWVVCNMTQVCIPNQWICNGINNCGDNSDEEPPYNCTLIQESRANNLTSLQGDYCIWPYVKCPGEDFCAVACDGNQECTLENFDESADAGCTGTACRAVLTATSAEQEFTSPNYPNTYSSDTKCEWVINAPTGQNIQLTFKFIAIEGNGGDCRQDFLRVHNGINTSASVIKIAGNNRLCGYAIPSPASITSTKSTVTVYLETDSNYNEEGFAIAYKAVAASRQRRESSDVAHFADDFEPFEAEKLLQPFKQTQQIRRRRSSNATGTAAYSDYQNDYYSSLRTGADYDAYYNSFNPTDQYFNVSDYFSLYEKSDLPDYSDFRLAATFTQSEMKYNGYQKSDFIVQCTFDSKKCNSNWFKTFQNPYYGNCFSFNSIIDRNISEPIFIRSSSKTGQEFGLKLTLFLDVEDYIGILGQNAGARAMVYDPEVRANVRSQSFAVGAGLDTFISMRMHQVEREGGRYGNCTSSWPRWLELNSDFKQKWPKYDRETCLFFCVENAMASRCQCIDSYETNYSINSGINNASNYYCDPTDKVQSECRQNIYRDFKSNNLSCSRCPQGCKTTSFSQQQSMSPWPTENFSPFFVSKMLKSNSERVVSYVEDVVSNANISQSTLSASIRRNFARLEVYYETLNFEKMSESPGYEIVDLLSDFGGNIGLWIGWSVLALFEILQFVYEVGEIIYLKKLKRD